MSDYCSIVERFKEAALNAKNEEEVAALLIGARQMLVKRGFYCSDFGCLGEVLDYTEINRPDILPSNNSLRPLLTAPSRNEIIELGMLSKRGGVKANEYSRSENTRGVSGYFQKAKTGPDGARAS